MSVLFRDRPVTDLVIEDVHTWDYPDFADAYLASAVWEDTGEYLTQEELDAFYNENPDVIWELAYDSLH